MKQGLLSQILFTTLIPLISYIGDKGLQNGKTETVRAISDNLTHASVGAVTWALVLVLSKKHIYSNIGNVICCFFISSLVDVDHFIEAGSWDINDATRLDHRPFLHCTTIPILLLILMSLLSIVLNVASLITYAWMIFASFVSHHVRDGNRRGLWFWPFGSTKPIPYYWYLIICALLPYFINWMMEWQVSKSGNKIRLTEII